MRWGAIVVALGAINAFVLFVCILCNFPLWAICASSAIGAAIGLYEARRSRQFVIGGFAGSAGGLFLCFGLGMFGLPHMLN
jgi:hypothetical protein